MAQRRNPRAGVSDRWVNRDGSKSSRHGAGKRWLGRYVASDGMERTQSFDRKTDAQNWVNRQVSDQVVGTWVDPGKSAVTFGAMAERWFATKANRQPKTVAGYRSLLDTVILPRWAAVPLRDVAFDELQIWVTGLSVNGSARFEGKGLSASRVRQTHQLMGAVFKFAVKARHIATNPADGVDLPQLPDVDQRRLTHEELHRLAIACGRFRTYVFTLGYCGLRFGEAAALQVRDLDLSGNRIQVRRSVTYVAKTGQVEGPTKNHRARTVPVPAFLVKLLSTEVTGRGGEELVFPGRRAEWLTLGEVRWVFDPAAEKIGQDGLTPHQLRHTCASLAIAGGANVKVLQRLLGHKSAVMTLDRYGHLFPDDLDAIGAAFDTAARAAADQLRTSKPARQALNGPTDL